MSSRGPITRAEGKRILEALISDAIDLINQFSLQDETPSESVPTEPVRLEIVPQFVQLFHRRIPQRNLMSQFYAIIQEVNETVPQFVIRFQNLRKQLTRSPTPEELTEIFLTGLHEPLWTTLQVIDLSGQTIEEVIKWVLHLDRAQSMSMASLKEALPTTEET